MNKWSVLMFIMGASVARSAIGAEKCAADEVPMAKRNAASVLWTACTIDKSFRQQFSYPAGAKIFPYSAKIFTEPSDVYPSDLTKNDIVWIATDIQINEPLRSFGGDIVLVAETIEINAPIDTRVYIESDVDHFAAPVTTGTQQERIQRTYNTYKFVQGTKYTPALDDYYSNCRACDRVGTRKSEMPGGITAASPDESGGASAANNGEDAPSKAQIDYSSVKSGNIYIFAKSIKISDSLKKPTPPVDMVVCVTKNDRSPQIPFALNASGLDGARGGMGSLHCAGHAPRTAMFIKECHADEFVAMGGVSGKGSDGADGGDITLILPKDDDPDHRVQIEQALKQTATVEGGLGVRTRYQTPSFEGEQQVGSDRCSFPAVSNDADVKDGKNGEFTIIRSSDREILSRLATILSSMDLRNYYDYSALLNIARIDESIHALSPSAAYSDYLSQSLLEAEDKHVSDIERVFVDHHKDVGGYLPWLLEHISDEDIRNAKIGEQGSELLEALLEYQTPDGVMSPFRASGGLFNIPSSVFAQMSAGQIRVPLKLANETLTAISIDLRDINSEVVAYSQQRRSTELRQQLETLQTAIAAAEAQAERAAQSPGVLDQLSNLKDLGQAVAGIIGAVYSGQYLAAAAFLEPAAKAFAKLTASNPAYSDAAVTPLQQQLRVVQSAFQSLTTFMTESKEAFITLKYQAVMQELNSRATLRNELDAQAMLVPNITKVVLASYFEDLGGSEMKLRQNLSEVHRYIDGFPYKTGFVSLADLDHGCADRAQC